jgi:RNA polymerase sigma factor (sigma-70 family)
VYDKTGDNTDQQLVARVLNGDTRAFETIIKNTEGLVAQIVFKMVGHSEDRRDLAQEVYMKAFRNLSSFRFQSKLSTWIGQISYNACLSHLKKKKLVFVETLLEGPAETRGTSWTARETEDRILQRELSTIIQRGIERLPSIYRLLITLYHQEEQTYEEIGQITGLPEGTVKSYLFRARKSLKENLLAIHKKEEL